MQLVWEPSTRNGPRTLQRLKCYNPSRGLFWFSDMKVTADWTRPNAPSPYSFQSTIKSSNYTYFAMKITATLPIITGETFWRDIAGEILTLNTFWQAAVQVNKKAVKHLTATTTSYIPKTQSSKKNILLKYSLAGATHRMKKVSANRTLMFTSLCICLTSLQWA